MRPTERISFSVSRGPAPGVHSTSGFNLLINAIIYWNTLYLEPVFAELNREEFPRRRM